MRILLLTQWFPPEPQKLLLELAETLQALGHEVTVLTGFPNYPSGKLAAGYRLRWWQKERLNGVPVIRVPLYPNHSRSAVKRALNFVSFAVSAALLGVWLVPRVDVIHVIHPPLTMGLPAWVLSRVRRASYTYEIQDMWPETLRATGMISNERVLSIVGWFAKMVYRRAAAIRVISPGFRKNLLAKGVPGEKIHVISNWVDPSFYRPVSPDPGLAARFGLAGRFNVMYAGAIGLGQGLDVVLDAAILLRDLPDVQFVLVGDGVDSDRLQQIAHDRKLDNVKFLGRHPQEAMCGLYAMADVLLLHLRDDPLFRITIPHKTFAYMASAKPVLAAIDGDAADVVTSAGAGLACQASNPEALAATVRTFHDMSPTEREAMGAAGRRAVCESFNRPHLIGEIAKMLQSVVAHHNGSPIPAAD